MDKSNVDFSPISFQENVSWGNWTLESASLDNLMNKFYLFKHLNDKMYDDARESIAAAFEKHVIYQLDKTIMLFLK